MAIDFSIALTHLQNRRRQTAVSVMGVALGVGFFVAVSSLMRGSEQDFIEKLVDSAPHITVKDEYRAPPLQPVERLYAAGAVSLRSLKPRDEVRGIRNYKAKLDLLSRLDGVDVAPALLGQVILRYGAKDVSATLNGIEPARERLVTQLVDDMIVGTLDDLETTANGIIIGRALADKLKAGVGDNISVISTAGVVRKMKVVGLFSTGVVAIDEGTIYSLIKKAQVLLDRPQTANRLRLRLAEPNSALELSADIESRVGYLAESWQEANEDVLSVLVIRNAIMYSIVGAILVVASFGIFNIISTVVLEKTRDIAILKSMGFNAGDIRRIFLIEGVLVGISGSVLGWIIGYGMLAGLATIQFKPPGFTEEQGFPLYEGIDQYLIAGGFALLSATLAAYLPARRASALKPVDILRGAA